LILGKWATVRRPNSRLQVFQNTNRGPLTENGKRKDGNLKLKHEAKKPVCISNLTGDSAALQFPKAP